MSTINFTNFTNAAMNACDLEHEELLYKGEYITHEVILDPDNREMQSIRQETWKIFQKVITSEFDVERVSRISQRYFRQELSQIVAIAPPFLPVYVDMFGVGLANLNVSHLQQKLGLNKRVEDCTVEEIAHLCKRAYPAEYIGQRRDPEELLGGPSRPFEYIKYDSMRQDQKRLNLYQGVEKLKDESAGILKENHPFLQRLSMAIVHHDMQVGDIIEAPGENGKKDFYKLYQNIIEEGCVAIALVPVSKQSNLRPILAFRPTATSLNAQVWKDTWINNILKYNGEKGYNAAREKFNRLMNDPQFYKADYKPIVVAYSLGGAFAGYFFRDHWPKIWQSVFFNTVSNSDPTVAEDAAKAINSLDPDQNGVLVYIYRNVTSPDGKKGDWAHFLGGKHVGCGIKHARSLVEVTEIQVPNESPTNFGEWMVVHSVRFMDSKDKVFPTRIISQDDIDLCLDNKQRGEEVYHYEVMRQKVGVDILYYVVNIAYEIMNLIFRILGIQIFRNSQLDSADELPPIEEKKSEEEKYSFIP